MYTINTSYAKCCLFELYNGSKSIIHKHIIPGCCSVTQLRLTFRDSMDCSTPGFPVLHHLLDLAETDVH